MPTAKHATMKRNNHAVECVPNVSEGKNKDVLDAIAKAISDVPGVSLLHRDSSATANRTVFTFTGDLDSVFEAAFSMYRVASERIDMRHHKGTHPRIGAVDVCPFIALEGCDEELLKTKVKSFGKRLADELRVSGFFYEKSAMNNQRSNLATIRRGEYEGLDDKLKSIAWKPDFGKNETLDTFGATTIGVRDFLIAFNVNLKTKDRKIAQHIAEMIRELGKIMTQPDGSISRLPGLLRSVKGIGWYVDEYNMAQVSYNLTNIDQNGLFEVFESTKASCVRYNTETYGSELIGLIPLKEMVRTGKRYAKRNYRDSGQKSDEYYIDLAVRKLGLNALRPFNPDERILEYCIAKNENGTEEVTSESSTH